MATNSGELNTFGDVLNHIGFWGASRLNPNDMKNNCVSVSVANMEYYPDVPTLWADIYGAPLPDKPLNLPQIEDLISRTNFKFRWVQFNATTIHGQHVTAYDNLRYNFPASSVGGSGGARGRPLALYIRTNGSGHCVNASFEIPEAPGAPMHPKVLEGEPTEFTFQDWQQGEGVDCEADVKAAQTIIIGYQAEYLGTPQDYMRAIERRIQRKQARPSTGPYDY